MLMKYKYEIGYVFDGGPKYGVVYLPEPIEQVMSNKNNILYATHGGITYFKRLDDTDEYMENK